MATTILITCPECKKQFKGPGELLGRKIRCKSCTATFVVKETPAGKPAPATRGAPAAKGAPAAQPAKGKGAPAKPPDHDDDGPAMYSFADPDAAAPAPKPAAPPPDKSKQASPKVAHPEDAAGKNPYVLTDVVLSPRCPQCAFDMESADDVICLNCGYNLQTRVRMQTVKTYQTTTFEWILWLGPGILCVLGDLALIGGICWLWLGLKGEEQWVLAAQIWGTVIALIIGYKILGKYAFRRLVKDFRPPERIKRG
jgi:hypothetical protein